MVYLPFTAGRSLLPWEWWSKGWSTHGRRKRERHWQKARINFEEMGVCSPCPCVIGMTVAGNGQTSAVEPMQRSWLCNHQRLFFCFLCPMPQTHPLNTCYFQFPLFWYSRKKVLWAISHPPGTFFVWRQFWQNQGLQITHENNSTHIFSGYLLPFFISTQGWMRKKTSWIGARGGVIYATADGNQIQQLLSKCFFLHTQLFLLTTSCK